MARLKTKIDLTPHDELVMVEDVLGPVEVPPVVSDLEEQVKLAQHVMLTADLSTKESTVAQTRTKAAIECDSLAKHITEELGYSSSKIVMTLEHSKNVLTLGHEGDIVMDSRQFWPLFSTIAKFGKSAILPFLTDLSPSPQIRVSYVPLTDTEVVNWETRDPTNLVMAINQLMEQSIASQAKLDGLKRDLDSSPQRGAARNAAKTAYESFTNSDEMVPITQAQNIKSFKHHLVFSFGAPYGGIIEPGLTTTLDQRFALLHQWSAICQWLRQPLVDSIVVKISPVSVYSILLRVPVGEEYQPIHQVDSSDQPTHLRPPVLKLIPQRTAETVADDPTAKLTTSHPPQSTSAAAPPPPPPSSSSLVRVPSTGTPYHKPSYTPGSIKQPTKIQPLTTFTKPPINELELSHPETNLSHMYPLISHVAALGLTTIQLETMIPPQLPDPYVVFHRVNQTTLSKIIDRFGATCHQFNIKLIVVNRQSGLPVQSNFDVGRFMALTSLPNIKVDVMGLTFDIGRQEGRVKPDIKCVGGCAHCPYSRVVYPSPPYFGRDPHAIIDYSHSIEIQCETGCECHAIRAGEVRRNKNTVGYIQPSLILVPLSVQTGRVWDKGHGIDSQTTPDVFVAKVKQHGRDFLSDLPGIYDMGWLYEGTAGIQSSPPDLTQMTDQPADKLVMAVSQSDIEGVKGALALGAPFSSFCGTVPVALLYRVMYLRQDSHTKAVMTPDSISKLTRRRERDKAIMAMLIDSADKTGRTLYDLFCPPPSKSMTLEIPFDFVKHHAKKYGTNFINQIATLLIAYFERNEPTTSQRLDLQSIIGSW